MENNQHHTEDSRITVSSNPTVYHESSASITKQENSERFYIKNSGNHNEITMMENDWIQIKRKIELLSFKKRLDIQTLLIGAMVPYFIDILLSFINEKPVTFAPLLILIVLYIFCNFLSKKIDIFQEERIEDNILHLNDLKEYVKQIDSNANKTKQ